MPLLGVAMTTASIPRRERLSERGSNQGVQQSDSLGDSVHVGDLFLVPDDLDGRPHILDHLGVGLPLLHHT